MIGQTFSHYRIIKELGKGGMGVVYLAEDTTLGRLVAIKTLIDLNGPGRQHYHTRFLREAQVISKLSHRHIATIHDYGKTADGTPYIVMEFVKGGTLADLMNTEKLTIARVLEIISEVAEGLSEAHRQGIVHRDIKPSNVGINERGEVKVLDFGLAKHFSSTTGDPTGPETNLTETREDLILGTPAYLSPEQALGLSVDTRSDIFSLGSLLYECLTGTQAFSGKSASEIRARVIRDDPPPPSQINANISTKLDSVALKALAKKPDERYQSAEKIVEDLRAVGVTSDTNGRASLTAEVEDTTSKSILHRPQTVGTSHISVTSPRFSIRGLLVAVSLTSLVALGLWYVLRPKPYQPSAAAQRWYDIGTNDLREGAYFKAIKPLEQAVAEDDKFALAHARLAEAWTELDYTDRAQRELLRVDGLVPNRNALPELERLYLDAIRATLTRELGEATKAYQSILMIKPNDPQALIDLGRAYEKDEQIDAAINSYNSAASRDSQNPAAFLRLGILYGRKRDTQNASAAFERADALFQTLGDLEGHTEVVYQRGVVFRESGQLSEAQDQLQKAVDISRTSGNQYQQIKSMLRLSAVLYLRGTTEQARDMATTAVNLAQSNGIENLATQGLIDLGTTYLVRREYPNAELVFKQALDIARRNSGRRNEATALYLLAALYIQQETRIDEALDYLKQASEFFEPGHYDRELSQVILYRGRAKLLKGDYDGALQDFEVLLPLATRINDRNQLASTYTLIGNLLFARELYPDALRNFDEGYNLYKALDIPLSVAYLILDRSEMLWRLGQPKEAETVLSELPSWINRIDNNYRQVLLSRTALARAGIAASQEDFSRAKSEAELAIKLAGKPNNHTAVEAKCILGSVLIHSGANREGLRVSQETVEMATQINDQHLLSQALLVQAEALLESGDPKQALSVALQCQDRFAHANQQESEARSWLIAARATQVLNDHTRARAQLTRANQLLSGLDQKWGPEAFKKYLSRSDVKALWARISY